MLVLSRKVGEKIRIGNDIVISVVESASGHAKLGIEAPRETIIYREEVYAKTKQQNKEAIIDTAQNPSILSKLKSSFIHKTDSTQDENMK